MYRAVSPSNSGAKVWPSSQFAATSEAKDLPVVLLCGTVGQPDKLDANKLKVITNYHLS